MLPRSVRRVSAPIVVALFAACSSSESTPSTPASTDGCSINSECASPLVCAFRRCHTACESSRDCPDGQRCMASDRPFHVCQLPEEEHCSYNSDCPTAQVCGVDGQCRDQCGTDRDCVSGQTCVQGTCAEPDELDGGHLPVADSGAADVVTGLPCSYNSECQQPLVCRGGLCAYECLADVDCPEGKSCSEHRCRALGPDGCALTSCAAQGKTCGTIDDHCGGTLDCGPCPSGQTCGAGGTPNVCGTGACAPKTCADLGANCGSPSDGCSATLDCGACAPPDVCGGGGTPYVCACEPTSCGAQGKDCGAIADGCGGLLSCGVCPAPAVCGGGGIANVCGVPVAPASCLGVGASSRYACGPGNDDCCKSIAVPGGSFNRDNDPQFPATLSPFQLDRYLVTVARFRAFVQAGLGTQTSPPPSWSGGLPSFAASGWAPTWSTRLPVDTAALRASLVACGASTWTDSPGPTENSPVNCVSFYLALAFCAWDGGYLPTEAQLSFAQSGGSEQRFYPWSTPPDSQVVDGTYMNYWGSGNGNLPTPVGAKSPKGDGRWGHADLVGNLGEWLLDVWSTPLQYSSCNDCVALGPGGDRTVRGGSYYDYETDGTSASRTNLAADTAADTVGFRCAR